MEEKSPSEKVEVNTDAVETAVRCPNCNKKQKKSFKYCPKCGQRNTSHKVSFLLLLQDLFKEELHLNNKTFRSIRLLLLKPGALTRAYIDGRKKSMLTPTKLFIWTGFLLIALMLPTLNKLGVNSENGPIQFNIDEKTEESSYDNNTMKGKVGNYFRDMLQEANDHPKEFMQKLLRRFPFVLLGILPGFAVFLRLVYRKRKMYFLEHLVFLLHFHAFAFLMLSLLMVLMLIFPLITVMNKIVFAALFVYFLLAYKNVYQHRWPGTIVRGSLLSLFFLITVPIFLVLLSLFIALVF